MIKWHFSQQQNRKGPVWEFFKEPDSVVCKKGKTKLFLCKLCDQVPADVGGTTNLLNYLQSKHPEKYKCCSPVSRKSSSKQTLKNAK